MGDDFMARSAMIDETKRFVTRQNIVYFHEIVAETTDEAKLSILRELLAKEQAKLERCVHSRTVGCELVSAEARSREAFDASQ
jgi:hypothetical protein